MDMLRQAIQKLENKRERTPAEQLQLRQLRDDLFWVEFDQSVRAMPNAGVGLVLDRAMDGTLHIIEVVPGRAAAQDGRIQRGDILLGLNGQLVMGRSVDELRPYILGPTGTQIELLIQRGGAQFPVLLVRGGLAGGSSNQGGLRSNVHGFSDGPGGGAAGGAGNSTSVPVYGYGASTGVMGGAAGMSSGMGMRPVSGGGGGLQNVRPMSSGGAITMSGSIRPGPNVSSRGAQKYHAQRGGGGAGSPSLSPGGAGAAGGGAGGGDCELMGLFLHKKVLVFILERAIKKLRAWAGMYLCMYYTYVCTYVCVYSYKETHSTMTFP